ncbi:transmembrane protein 255B isoform X2 [Pleuronectes platessa]|uniref:transmembrane protein 255B isoform X2 n=1 Tax=Pleuronectes platessa TaxID=8262 RepID=UPI00232A7104|nr:transmembrane protein 255B isoform X2 [Pleuronectes platessa]
MTAWIQGTGSRDKAVPKSRAAEMTVRVRRALLLVGGMLSLSLLLVVLGVYTTTRTESLNVTGYISGVILTLGSFLGLLGLCLEENRKQLDMRPLSAGRCQYYSSGSSYLYENFYTSVSCWNLKESCTMTVRSGTCYCCDLYDCANGGYLSNYYEFVGVDSCEEVFTLYILIWILTGLNLVALFTGILVTAVLGSIKDLRSSSTLIESPEGTATSPTAPRLMNTNTHTVPQLYPEVSMYFPPAEKAPASQSFPSSSSTSHSESSPPPFAPLTNLLPFRAQGFSA